MKSFFLFIFISFLFLSCEEKSLHSKIDNSNFTVLIDAAHGGKDTGAISENGIQEKELSMLYSSLLENELKHKNISVIKTRKQDEFVSLKRRIQKAKDGKIDLLISIHFNASKNESNNGFESFFQQNNSQSIKLDNLIHSEISALSQLNDNGSKSISFYLLKNSPSPAILMDLGYITNKTDMDLFKSLDFQKKFSKLIAEAIIKYSKS